jgi:hypothetical protein
MKTSGIFGKRGRQRGTILITAFMVIVVMLLIATPFLVRLAGASRSTERASRALTAFSLAEAGVDKVMWFLNPYSSPSGADAEAIQWDPMAPGTADVGVIHNLKAADGSIMGDVHVVLTAPVDVPPAPPVRTLTSTGMVPFIADNTVNRTVRVTLMQGIKGAFDYGFFANQYFYIRNGFFLDAYDSRLGGYGTTQSDGTTNSMSPDVYFGSNTYIDANNPNNPGDATWVIEQGGGSDVYGTVQAGGYAAEAYNNGEGEAPDSDLLSDVINVPKGMEVDSQVMKQEFLLPPVDVYNLPPKENLGAIPPVGDWFNNYNATNPESSTGYYSDRLNRAPLASEIESGYVKGTFSGSGNLTPADSGFYTSFSIGGYGTGGTLNISGGDVVIYVSSYGDAAKAGSFYMGKDSSINIAPDSSLTLIYGNTSVTVEQGYNINAQGSPPIPGNCVILGTNQFAVPPNAKLPLQPGTKATDVDAMRIPGFMFFEHAQSDGNIYAALYAPKATMADLQGQNHMNFYGSAIVEAMAFKVQVDFHYDKALSDLDLIDAGFKYWTIINWTELVGAGN